MININKRRFDVIREDLHRAYGHEYSAAEINRKTDEVIAKHSQSANLEEFVPVMVERELKEHFGDHRIHVRFVAGSQVALAQAAVALTKKHAGEALVVDAAATYPEISEEGHMAHVLHERGMLEPGKRYLDEVRTVAMPDYIVYLGRHLEREEAGKDVKIWDIENADDLEATRELADDLEARVLYMLNRLGIDPVREGAAVEA